MFSVSRVVDRFRQLLRRWLLRRGAACLPGWQQRRGSVAVMVGLILPVVIAAATARTHGYPTPSLEAQAVASQMAADNRAGTVTLAGNIPPASGSLSGSDSGAVSVSGSATVNLTGCSLEVDSTSASSISVGGAAELNCTGLPVQAIGGGLVSLVE
jgi:hypothetical protein